MDLSPASPQAKIGTLLIHRQQEVNLKEVHKADQFQLCLTSTHLRSIFGWLVECYENMPVACELYLLCRRTGDNLKVFSAVFLHKQGVQSPEDLLDVILRQGERIYIQLLSAGGKLILNFLLASVPSLSCFHVNSNKFVSLIQLSPSTLMNSTQPAERFLY